MYCMIVPAIVSAFPMAVSSVCLASGAKTINERILVIHQQLIRLRSQILLRIHHLFQDIHYHKDRDDSTGTLIKISSHVIDNTSSRIVTET